MNNLGGAMQTDEISDATLANVFPNVLKAEADSGEIRYAAIYIYNSNANSPVNTSNIMLNPICVLLQDSTSPNDEIWIAWDPAGPGATGQQIINQLTPPSNITAWYNGKERTTGAVLGHDILPGQGAMLWLKNIIKLNAGSQEDDTSVIDIITDNISGAIDLPDQTTFSAFGDSDCNTTLSTIIGKINKRNPTFILSLGNNNFTDNASCYISAWGSTSISKMYPTLGPQENTFAAKRNQYLNQFASLFTNTWDYYSFDMFNIHILVMDTSHAWGVDSEQYDFIKRDLDRAAANPATDWIIVISHDVWFSSWTEKDIVLGFSAEYIETAGQRKSSTYMPIFAEHGVHLVICSRPENSQVSYPLQPAQPTDPIQGGGNPTPVLQSQSPNFIIPTGEKKFPLGASIYLIAGTGGKAHEQFHESSAGDVSPSPLTAFGDDENYGYWYFTIRNNPLPKKLTAQFYNPSDTLLYTFTITKD